MGRPSPERPDESTLRRLIILRERGVRPGASKLLGPQLGFEIAALIDALLRLDSA
jgi:hypothetical protein